MKDKNKKFPDVYPESFSHVMPPESQSRQLDMYVQAQEKPYGYLLPPSPPADSGDYNEYARESHKEYPRHKR